MMLSAVRIFSGGKCEKLMVQGNCELGDVVGLDEDCLFGRVGNYRLKCNRYPCYPLFRPDENTPHGAFV